MGDSGMFTVDHGLEVDEPLMVKARAYDLNKLSKSRLRDTRGAYGLQFPETNFEKPPVLKYLHYRWPRYEYKTDKRELTIQWMVHKGIVLQQILLRNLEDTEVRIPFFFQRDKKSMWIRDLEYLNYDHNFNDTYEDYSEQIGPNNYSWTLAHSLEEQNEMDSLNHDRPINNSLGVGGIDPTNSDKKKLMESIAVVVSVFLDGEAVQWTNKSHWERLLGSKTSTRNEMEVITAYNMIHLPASQAHWKTFLIPAELTDVNALLQDVPFSSLRLSMVDETSTNKQNIADEEKSEERVRITHEDPSGIPSDSVLPKNHIEFVVRRHLEHILSVCSIPLRYEQSDRRQPRPEESAQDISDCSDMWGYLMSSSLHFS